MSFLIDGPWLYANGRAIARATDDPAPLAAGTMAVFWGVSIPLYLNQRWTRPIWRACRASSGRDWMINSGVLRVDADGRVHGTEGVYVCDGSAVPSSLGVNPQITIMTLATRLAHHLCRS